MAEIDLKISEAYFCNSVCSDGKMWRPFCNMAFIQREAAGK